MRETLNRGIEGGNETEAEKAITYIYLLRHSNRYAGKNEVVNIAGETITVVDPETLSPQGEQTAKEFGKSLSDFDLVHTLSSIEERAQQTGDLVKQGSGVVGKKRGDLGLSASSTRKVSGISYTEVSQNPSLLKQIKKTIASNLPSNFADLSPEERGKVRGEYQDQGLKHLLEHENMVQEEAEGVAFQLMHAKLLSERGVAKGTKVAIPIITHGTFPEAFFMKALVIEDNTNSSRQVGIKSPDDIGGFIKQVEGLEIKLTRDDDGEKIDCRFTNPDRNEIFSGKKISLDWEVVKQLARDYISRVDNKNEQAG